MLLPGNMWLEAWESARPVPARRQKRLFDDTKEAEKVIKILTIIYLFKQALHFISINLLVVLYLIWL